MIEPLLYRDDLKTKAFAHQVQGTRLLVNNPAFALFDEMGAGKTKQTIDAACILACEALISLVLVVAPSTAKGVWSDPDPELGEIAKHAWVPTQVTEFHAKVKTLWTGNTKVDRPGLCWLVTNYEFIRQERHLERLQSLLSGVRYMMVCDESAFIKSHKSKQFKSCRALGRSAAKRAILNGTPIAKNPLDMWAQMNFLDPRILPFQNFFHFRNEFAVMAPNTSFPKILSWRRLDYLQELIAPYAIRREKKDCLDLPEKVQAPPLQVKLSPETWKLYKEMRRDAIVWLGEHPSAAAHAGSQAVRLAQICGGFLGGFQSMDEADPTGAVMEIGREKLEGLREWLAIRMGERPRKVIVWARFRAEIDLLHRELASLARTYKFYGGQRRAEREEARGVFSRKDATQAIMVGQPHAGGFAQNFVGADTVVYFSNDFSLWARKQSEDRVHRPGQRDDVLYMDVMATGPEGQRTVDHHAVKVLREDGDLATWTASAWKRALEEDVEMEGRD